MAAETFERRILVTGGAGFIGSHVVIRLVQEHPRYKIINLDKLDYCSSLKNLQCIEHAPNYEFIKGNILSSDLVSYVLKKERIDTIMHLAAQTHVDNSFGNSFTFTENNILGTHVLLEAAKVHGLGLFIHCSTDEVYGEGELGDKRMSESSVLEPTNPYAASKAGAEYLVKAYARSFGMKTIITRGNNVYGPHQYPEKIIPKFINQLLRDLKCTIHGDGANTRNYLFVEDVARAFDCILHKGTPGCIYNIGSSCEVSNLEVARGLAALVCPDRPLDDAVSYVEDRPFNDLRYPLHSDSLRALGWREQVDWNTGLKLTVEWYKAHPDRWEDVASAIVAHPRRGWTAEEMHISEASTASSQDAKPSPTAAKE